QGGERQRWGRRVADRTIAEPIAVTSAIASLAAITALPAILPWSVVRFGPIPFADDTVGHRPGFCLAPLLRRGRAVSGRGRLLGQRLAVGLFGQGVAPVPRRGLPGIGVCIGQDGLDSPAYIVTIGRVQRRQFLRIPVASGQLPD